MTLNELIDFIENKMRMSHVYQPLLITCLLDADDSATVPELATKFAVDPILHRPPYGPKEVRAWTGIIQKYPLDVLKKHGVVDYREGQVFLNLDPASAEERARIRRICEREIARYLSSANTGSMTDSAGFVGDLEWALALGDVRNRKDLKEIYGGSPQGGIAKSSQTPNILCFSDPKKQEQHGYRFDGWVDKDQLFQYTGHGQSGDQVFAIGREGLGNADVRDHRDTERTLRVFMTDGFFSGTRTGRQVYIGEFKLDRDTPFVRAESEDNDGDLRSVIVFRLLPVGKVLIRPEDRCLAEIPPSGTDPPVEMVESPIDPEAAVEDIDFPDTEQTTFERPPTGSVKGELREKELVKRYRKFLTDRGHKWGLRRYPMPGSSSKLTIDLLDKSRNELVEAKSTSTRERIRYAIGQLMDYERKIRPDSKAILLPSLPSDDLLDLIQKAGVVCIVEEAAGVFERIEP